MKLTIKVIKVGSQQENCYLLAMADEAWIIDPGDEFELIIQKLNLGKYQLNGIINTHGHFDHIGAVAQIKERYNIPFFLHSKDIRLVNQGNLYRRMEGELTTFKTPSIDNYLDDLEPLKIQNKKILIHHIPGHTHGSVCFEIGNDLFTGDLIFKNSIGRTDLPGGNRELLLDSISYIFEKFIGFKIHPGHGKSFVLDEFQVNRLKLNF